MMVKRYIEFIKENSNSDDINPMHYLKYISDNDVNKIEKLLKSGWDPSVNNNTSISVASDYGYLEIVKLLLQDDRVDPTTSDYHPLRWSIINNHLEVFKTLLSDNRVDPTYNNNALLRLAFNNERWKFVELLLRDDRIRFSDNELYRKCKREIMRMYREGLLP